MDVESEVRYDELEVCVEVVMFGWSVLETD